MSVTPLRSPSTISGLTGWFTGFSAEMNALNQLTRWRDLSGKGNHVESSAIRSGSINLSASATNENVYDSPSTSNAKLGVTPFPFLYGSTDAGLQFPTNMMTTTSNYTLFHVARYYKPGDAVPTRRRIFDGVTSNWLSGFHGSKSGVAYHHNNWLTSQTDIHGDTWVLSTDQRDMYRSNGTNRTVSEYSGGSSRQLSINYGASTNQPSDWACAEVIVYDRELDSTEYEAVEAYLNAKYFSTNLKIPLTGPISLMSFATYLHDGTGYPISLQSLASKIGRTSSIGFSDFKGEAKIPRVSPVVVTTSDLPTQVFTIRAPSFTSVPSIKFVGVDGIPHDVSSTTYVSQGVATFTLGTLSQTELENNQPFKIKIGSDTSIDTISSFISLPTRRENESLTYDLNNDLGVSPYTRTGTLPDGLSISGGILSGTLTTAGTYDFALNSQLLIEPGGNWTEQAKINADNSLFASYNFFGHTVSISSDGNTAIVGAYGQESAYIFIRSNGNWTQQAKIEASDKASGDNFGLGVAISGDGNAVIVGAPREDPGDPAVTNAGSAYIFTHANGNWTQQAKINGSGNVYIGSFGARVAISGDGNTAIVGAPVKGSAYIFTRDSNGNWTQKEQFQESGVNFGDSVAISGDGNTAIVGAPREDVNGDVDAGSAYIFTHANGNWTQQAKINGSGSQYLGSFGSSVAISSDGNTAIVGAYKEWTDIANYGGSSYIFTRSNGNWTEQAKIYPSDQQRHDYYGRSVSISSDGNTAIAGAWAEDAGGTSNTGSAYIFTRSNGNWTEQVNIDASDKERDAQFGYSVSISGDGNTAIAGAWLDDLEGPNLNTGAAYIFALPLLSRDYRMVVTT